MLLSFGLRARYSASTVYGAEFRSQSPIFGTHTNAELIFDVRARYLVSTEYGADRIQSWIFGIYRIWC